MRPRLWWPLLFSATATAQTATHPIAFYSPTNSAGTTLYSANHEAGNPFRTTTVSWQGSTRTLAGWCRDNYCHYPIACGGGSVTYTDVGVGSTASYACLNSPCITGLIGDVLDPFSATSARFASSVDCEDGPSTWTGYRTILNAVEVSSGFWSVGTDVASTTPPPSTTPQQGGQGIAPTTTPPITTGSGGGVGSGSGAGAADGQQTGGGGNGSGSGSSSSTGGLTTAQLAGVIVTIVCSVCGLAFGVGWKIWKYNKQKSKTATGRGQHAVAEYGWNPQRV